jgi:glyoxylase-like metal-dependent hydrolase (beta-lactamase superfamily II)
MLVDTGLPNRLTEIENELQHAGCQPGNLRLIVLTHGDYDHAGNAAYLRERYGTKIAMHRDDSERVEKGDWNRNLKAKPDRFLLPFRIVSLFVKPGRFDGFEPDVYVEDGRDLAGYGFEGSVLHLPGHTRGSVGILTRGGDLFCGDLLDNIFGRPHLQFFIDDMAAAKASIAKLKGLEIDTVYPGHGKPFSWRRFLQSQQ